jgi:hypothetical protein
LQIAFLVLAKYAKNSSWAYSVNKCIFVNNKTINKMKTQLQPNEFFRINSYYWQGMIYIALEAQGDKTLCKIKDSKATPKWIKTNQLSKTAVNF